jgi:CRP-like cAMP-binding protein
MLDDGRRQVLAFYLPGDIFGVEAGDVHLSSSEAISESQVLVAKRSAVLARDCRNCFARADTIGRYECGVIGTIAQEQIGTGLGTSW